MLKAFTELFFLQNVLSKFGSTQSAFAQFSSREQELVAASLSKAPFFVKALFSPCCSRILNGVVFVMLLLLLFLFNNVIFDTKALLPFQLKNWPEITQMFDFYPLQSKFEDSRFWQIVFQKIFKSSRMCPLFRKLGELWF